LIRESIKKASSRFGRTSREVGLRRGDLATLLQHQGRYAEAETLFRHNVRDSCFANSDNDVARGLVNLGLLLKLRGNIAGAAEAYSQAMRKLECAKPPAPLQDLARLQNNMAAILAQRGQTSESQLLYHSALNKLMRVFGPQSQEVGVVRGNFAAMLLDSGRAQEADRLLAPSMVNAINSLGPSHPDTAHIASNLASAKYYQGAFESAAEFALVAFKANQASLGYSSPNTMISALNLTAILIKAGQHEQAGALLAKISIDAKCLWASPNPSVVPIIVNATGMLTKLDQVEVARRILKRFLGTSEGRQHEEVVKLYDAISAP